MNAIVLTSEKSVSGKQYFYVWNGDTLLAEFLFFWAARSYAVRTARTLSREAFVMGRNGKQNLYRPTFSKVCQ